MAKLTRTTRAQVIKPTGIVRMTGLRDAAKGMQQTAKAFEGIADIASKKLGEQRDRDAQDFINKTPLEEYQHAFEVVSKGGEVFNVYGQHVEQIQEMEGGLLGLGGYQRRVNALSEKSNFDSARNTGVTQITKYAQEARVRGKSQHLDPDWFQSVAQGYSKSLVKNSDPRIRKSLSSALKSQMDVEWLRIVSEREEENRNVAINQHNLTAKNIAKRSSVAAQSGLDNIELQRLMAEMTVLNDSAVNSGLMTKEEAVASMQGLADSVSYASFVGGISRIDDVGDALEMKAKVADGSFLVNGYVVNKDGVTLQEMPIVNFIEDPSKRLSLSNLVVASVKSRVQGEEANTVVYEDLVKKQLDLMEHRYRHLVSIGDEEGALAVESMMGDLRSVSKESAVASLSDEFSSAFDLVNTYNDFRKVSGEIDGLLTTLGLTSEEAGFNVDKLRRGRIESMSARASSLHGELLKKAEDRKKMQAGNIAAFNRVVKTGIPERIENISKEEMSAIDEHVSAVLGDDLESKSWESSMQILSPIFQSNILPSKVSSYLSGTLQASLSATPEDGDEIQIAESLRMFKFVTQQYMGADVRPAIGEKVFDTYSWIDRQMRAGGNILTSTFLAEAQEFYNAKRKGVSAQDISKKTISQMYSSIKNELEYSWPMNMFVDSPNYSEGIYRDLSYIAQRHYMDSLYSEEASEADRIEASVGYAVRILNEGKLVAINADNMHKGMSHFPVSANYQLSNEAITQIGLSLLPRMPKDSNEVYLFNGEHREIDQHLVDRDDVRKVGVSLQYDHHDPRTKKPVYRLVRFNLDSEAVLPKYTNILDDGVRILFEPSVHEAAFKSIQKQIDTEEILLEEISDRARKSVRHVGVMPIYTPETMDIEKEMRDQQKKLDALIEQQNELMSGEYVWQDPVEVEIEND